MKRVILAAIFVLAGAVNAFGQSTTVSGQVTDAGSQAWISATCQFQFSPNPQFPTGPYTWTGGTLNKVIPCTTNGSGAYSQSVPSNTAISPQGSKWILQVTPNATSPSFPTAPTTITGGTQTLNVTPPAIAIPWTNPPGAAISAYADAEITGNIPKGAEYFNTTTGFTRVWNGTSWATQGSGAGGLPGGSDTQLQYNFAGLFGGAHFDYLLNGANCPFITAVCDAIVYDRTRAAGINLTPPGGTVGPVSYNLIDLATAPDTVGGGSGVASRTWNSTGVAGVYGPQSLAGFFRSTVSGHAGDVASGVVGRAATDPGDLLNGQFLSGVVGITSLNKTTPGSFVDTASGFIVGLSACDFGGCTTIERAQHLYGLNVVDLGGFGTVETAGIKLRSQTAPASGTKFSIKADSGSGPTSVADGYLGTGTVPVKLPSTPGTVGQVLTSSGANPDTTIWTNSSFNCGPNCINGNDPQYGLNWNTKQISSATFTSGSGNVSTSASGTFAVTDIGKTIYGFTLCDTGSIATGQGRVLAQGTIDTFTDSTHVHATTNASANVSGTGCLYWGTPDDTGLSALDTAAQASKVCPSIKLPAGIGMATQAHFITQPVSCANSGSGLGAPLTGWGMVIAGEGKGVTYIALAPSLATANSATCTGGLSSNACFGGIKGQSWQNLALDGGGNYATGFGSTHKVFEFGSYSTALNFAFINFGASDTNAGIFLNGLGTVDWSFATIVGGPPITMATTGVYNFSHSAIQEGCQSVMATFQGIVNSSNSFYSAGPCAPNLQNSVTVQNGTFNSSQDFIFQETNANQINLVNIQGTGIANMVGSKFAGGATLGVPIDLAVTGAVLRAQDTVFTPGTSQTIAIFGVTGSQFIDLGGNTLGGTISGAPTYGSLSITGSPLVTGNIVLTSGWSTSTKGTISGDSHVGLFTVTAAGTPGAGPVITITYPKAYFTGYTPICSIAQVGGTFGTLTNPTTGAVSATTAAFSFTGTPIAAQTYTFQYNCQ